MRTVSRFAACAIGIIGAVDALILNVLVSLYHEVLRLTGADPNTHGWIGLGAVALAVIGAILVLFVPRAGAVLMLIAGIVLVYVLHWWALLATPQLIVGGLIPFLVPSGAERTAEPQLPHQAPGAPGPLAAQ